MVLVELMMTVTIMAAKVVVKLLTDLRNVGARDDDVNNYDDHGCEGSGGDDDHYDIECNSLAADESKRR